MHNHRILSLLKTIGADRDFQANNFFENVPLLLASETKTTISSTLQLLEKIIKGQPEHKVAPAPWFVSARIKYQTSVWFGILMLVRGDTNQGAGTPRMLERRVPEAGDSAGK